MDEVGGAIERVDDPHMICIGVAVGFARLFGQDAVVGVGSEQGFDDGVFAGQVDFGYKIIDLFLRNSNSLHVQGGAVDDGACGACSLDGYVEHGVEIGRHEFLRTKQCSPVRCQRRMAHFPMKLANRQGLSAQFGHFEALRTGTMSPMRTRFILIETSHPGNVGAAARALKVMGFDEMVLVAPRYNNVLRKEETIQRASGANDVLDKTRIVDTLEEALDGISHLCATAMTPRDFGPPTRSPREHFEMLLSRAQAQSATSFSKTKEPISSIGFLFGSERFGMKNEDVYKCHVALSIPTNPQFGSLNLAAALQLVAYEWRLALGGFPVASLVTESSLADAEQVSGMLGHFEKALVEIGFLDPAAPKKLMPRLNQLFNRANLTPEEIHILRGVAKAMIETAQAKR
jgi:tRNA/rRNA methyltransferase